MLGKFFGSSLGGDNIHFGGDVNSSSSSFPLLPATLGRQCPSCPPLPVPWAGLGVPGKAQGGVGCAERFFWGSTELKAVPAVILQKIWGSRTRWGQCGSSRVCRDKAQSCECQAVLLL